LALSFTSNAVRNHAMTEAPKITPTTKDRSIKNSVMGIPFVVGSLPECSINKSKAQEDTPVRIVRLHRDVVSLRL
jgi:hypothetical protein